MDMEFKMKMREKRKNVEDEYEFKGRKIGQGSYGIVFKAREKKGSSGEDFALKMIKPYRFTDGELQSVDITTIREIGLLRELKHPNVVLLIKVFFSPEDYNIWLLFDHAEFDLCYIIWQNRKMEDLKMVVPVPDSMVKSVLHQILKGVHFLQTNWVLHRDLKPANILVKGDCSERGRVKVADMGLARLFCSPLKPLTYQEPVVVTCWYRAPELLLGAQHYTKAIDVWSIGCIFAELLTYRPIFKCKYQEPKSKNPYHYDQLHRIFQVLGYPHDWEDKKYMSEYKSMQEDFKKPNRYANCKLERYMSRFGITPPSQAFNLLQRMLTMDPKKRITAEEALEDPYFSELPTPTDDVFDGNPIPYPQRAFITESKPEEEEKPIGKQRALIAEPEPEEEEKPIGKKKKLEEDETDCA